MSSNPEPQGDQIQYTDGQGNVFNFDKDTRSFSFSVQGNTGSGTCPSLAVMPGTGDKSSNCTTTDGQIRVSIKQSGDDSTLQATLRLANNSTVSFSGQRVE